MKSHLNFTLSVVPEYSYLVSGSYTTRFGKLSPGKNISKEGEFEILMKKVGCFIRNDYVPGTEIEKVVGGRQDSLINCAQSCFKNNTCGDGWSYQLATQMCYFYKLGTLEIEKLQPNTHILDNELTIGWATGLKSCSEAGSTRLFMKK